MGEAMHLSIVGHTYIYHKDYSAQIEYSWDYNLQAKNTSAASYPYPQ
jgi:hypothetical protein